MGSQRSIRKHRDSLDGLACIYCGEDAQHWDHVVAWSHRPATIGRVYGDPDVVPACRSCNLTAHNKLFMSVDDKREFIKNRIREKYEKAIRAPSWDEDELAELGVGLREHVEAKIAKREVLEDRLAWWGIPA